MSEKKEDDGPRFELEDPFTFQCSPGVSCFNECCQDVTIFLGPYDVLRVRQAKGLTAREFIDEYTTVLGTDRLIPLIALKMDDENDKRCFFVTAEGCSVYQYRPWACRMFPLDVTEDGKGFKTIIGDERCKGLCEEKTRRVQDYLNEQGSPKYQVMDDLMGDLINHPRFRALEIENQQVKQMIFMALYDLDSFRSFIFESSILQKFEIDARRVKRMKRDDEELLRFGFEWLAFGLLGRRNLKIRKEIVDEHKAKKAAGKGDAENDGGEG